MMLPLLIRRGALLGAAVLAAAATVPARAYSVFPLDATHSQKWGSDKTNGTPGGTVTWSLVPDGTELDPSAPAELSGTSDLASVFAQIPGGQQAALALMQQAFTNWSAVANIQFVYLGVDDGTPFGAPREETGQDVGDIRIGAFRIPCCAAAVGYGPAGYPPEPPDLGTTLAGDIAFNANEFISLYVAPGNEGDLYDLYPPGGGLYRNDFQGLFTHELGHGIGLGHSTVPDSVMCGYVDQTNNGSQCGWWDADNDGKAPIIRMPRPDDRAGAQYLMPEPNAFLMQGAGLVLLGALVRIRRARTS
jgi:hypothetical protein